MGAKIIKIIFSSEKNKQRSRPILDREQN